MKPADWLRDYLSKYGSEMDAEEYDGLAACLRALDEATAIVAAEREACFQCAVCEAEWATGEYAMVPPECRLGLACTFDWVGWSETIFSLSLHWQRDGKRRRPYTVIDAGPFQLQAGWLWSNPTAADSTGASTQ